MRTTCLIVALISCLLIIPANGNQSQNKLKILFVVGADGTVGWMEGWGNDQKASITDYSTSNGNHGWGELSDILRDAGYELEETTEGENGIDFASMDLNQYSVIVFGSNNKIYSSAQVDSVLAYIKKGGGALFISDANFGKNWEAASNSDQPFLDRIGWKVNQDNGTYNLSTSDFKDKEHPILKGVSSFDGEGVTPITLENTDIEGVESTILTPAKGDVRRNNGDPGSTSAAGSKDATLLVASVDSGRVAGHFDRNTFFNLNGAGTSINRYNNKKYALNLYAWLSKKEPEEPEEPTSVNFAEKDKYGSVKVYPNPFTNEIISVLDKASTYHSFNLVDLSGRLIYQQEITSVDIELKVSTAGLNLSQGIYFIKLFGPKEIKTIRIIKAGF